MREVALVEQYSKEELEDFVKNSKTFCEVLGKMGYLRRGGHPSTRLVDKLKFFNIDYSHLEQDTKYKNDGTRSDDEVFCENSVVVQSTVVNHYINKVPRKFCSICGQSDEWNGKKLVLILDHINGIYNDNRIENLRWVCPNCNSQLDTTGSKNKQSKCIDCSKIIKKDTLRCDECNKKWLEKINYNVQYVNKIPERNDLKKLVRNNSFCKVYNLYGVSRKRLIGWLKRYELPETKSEIDSISDENWEKL